MSTYDNGAPMPDVWQYPAEPKIALTIPPNIELGDNRPPARRPAHAADVRDRNLARR